MSVRLHIWQIVAGVFKEEQETILLLDNGVKDPLTNLTDGEILDQFWAATNALSGKVQREYGFSIEASHKRLEGRFKTCWATPAPEAK